MHTTAQQRQLYYKKACIQQLSSGSSTTRRGAWVGKQVLERKSDLGCILVTGVRYLMQDLAAARLHGGHCWLVCGLSSWTLAWLGTLLGALDEIPLGSPACRLEPSAAAHSPAASVVQNPRSQPADGGIL